jgi:hypothetical protein
MSLQMQVCCDVCGRLKREVNHWWVMLPSRLTGSRADARWMRTAVMPWNDEDAADPQAQHICGQACMLKAMERFMQGHEQVREPVRDEGRVEHYQLNSDGRYEPVRTDRYLEEAGPGGYDYLPGYQN